VHGRCGPETSPRKCSGLFPLEHQWWFSSSWWQTCLSIKQNNLNTFLIAKLLSKIQIQISFSKKTYPSGEEKHKVIQDDIRAVLRVGVLALLPSWFDQASQKRLLRHYLVLEPLELNPLLQT
jgi:hypothetical protein